MVLSKLIVLGAVGVSAHIDPLWKLFQEFKQQYNVEFESLEEDSKRFAIFKDNMNRAAELTKKSGGKTKFGLTKFSHLTKEEFKKTYLGYKPSTNGKELKKKWKKFFPKGNVKASTVDWRGTAATPVKDQGQCGSCWAFSATEAAETGYYFKTGKLKTLSPQQTTSCDTQDYGCNGGDTTTAYEYMRKAGGLELERAYPYTSGTTQRSGTCKARKNKFKVKVGASTVISQGASGESAMLEKVQSTPMSICVDAEPWQMYMGGIIDSSTCPTDLDHCVHLVGYQADGDYWIVKNSWNTDWGENGYIYVKQGENACGVAEEATIVDAGNEHMKDVTPTEVVQIIEGVAQGLGIKMADSCIDSSEDLFLKLKQAYDLVQKQDAMDMMKAMELIASALKGDVPAAAKACDASAQQVKDLIKSLAIIEHPKEFAYHVGQDLMVNGVNIYSEINASVGFYKAQQWEKFGLAIGKALEMIIIGNPEKDLYV